jgi:hypothetical protein
MIAVIVKRPHLSVQDVEQHLSGSLYFGGLDERFCDQVNLLQQNGAIRTVG